MPETPPASAARLTPEIISAFLAQRCREDAAFSEQLRRDPRAALADLSRQGGLADVPLPENIVLWENTPHSWHLAVPAPEVVQEMSKLPSEEALSDEALEDVQGGVAIVVSSFLFSLLSSGVLLSAAAVATGLAASAVVVGTATAIAVPVLQNQGRL